MQGIQGGVQIHATQSGLKPPVKFMAHNRGKGAVSSGNLEDRGRTAAMFLSIDFNQSQDGLNRTQQGVRGGSKGDLVISFAKLIIFRLRDRNEDALRDVIGKRGHVLPAENHLEVDRLGRLDDQIR